ncbi:cyclase [Kibdelosporangium persicum]|uniref:Cyclase-dehydratase n=1 Tax=Kibdelosporangium persicum TaxID=2698649 RepID=A0ABX2F5Y6_9PSEU|nr:cyclase [Kibdelosporangium persicum]NRN66776.1 Cyclase-dehydratase [Kibdelosporangium persicum]
MKLAPLRLATVAAFALAPLLALGTTASAAVQTINYQVRASAFGQTAELVLNQDIDATAPAGVAAGGAVTVTIDPAPNTVPAEGGGYEIREIKNIALKLPVPANSTFVSATATGGSGLGPAAPTVGLEGGDVVLKIAGPLKGGAAFELPTVTITLTAGSSGTIETKLGGTSYDAPGLTFTTVITAFGLPIDAATVAYPDPNPVLTSTTIG